VSFTIVLAQAADWVVLKFGGTSVSSVANWHNIAGVLRQRVAAGMRPVVVHSALSGITDRLESLLTAALQGLHGAVIDAIENTHRELAKGLNVAPGARFEAFMDELRRDAQRAADADLIEDALRARVMAMGELLSTTRS
jgi:diaminopimelate decarboxylase/aspartate kinase